MALTAADVPFDEVLPVKWQTVMGCRSGGDKNITKARAQQLFPHVKVTHAIADALLLAEFCRRAQWGSEQLTREGERDGKKAEVERFHVRFTKHERFNPETGRYEAVAEGRREGAARRADPPAPATGTAARRRRGSRIEADR
jgi:hypothetical protein